MTDTQLTHCHACGKETWLLYWRGEKRFCSEACAETEPEEKDPRIAALEADLAEALGLLEHYVRQRCGYPICLLGSNREAARLLAKHGRFKITRDDDWTEGEWVEKEVKS